MSVHITLTIGVCREVLLIVVSIKNIFTKHKRKTKFKEHSKEEAKVKMKKKNKSQHSFCGEKHVNKKFCQGGIRSCHMNPKHISLPPSLPPPLFLPSLNHTHLHQLTHPSRHHAPPTPCSHHVDCLFPFPCPFPPRRCLPHRECVAGPVVKLAPVNRQTRFAW